MIDEKIKQEKEELLKEYETYIKANTIPIYMRHQVSEMLDRYAKFVSERPKPPETIEQPNSKALHIADVSNQRELLIAFVEWFQENGGFPIEDWEVKKYVDGFIKSNI